MTFGCRFRDAETMNDRLGSPLFQRWTKLEERLDLRLDSLELLRENRTCWIYRARVEGESLVLKQYKRHARELCAREVAAVRLYSRLSREVPNLIPSTVRAWNVETGTVCVTFIEGELMSDVLRFGGRSARERARCCAALARVGELLRRVRQETSREAFFSPFLEEYVLHVSRLLEGLPGLGTFFAGYVDSARRLYEDVQASGEGVSLAHGDLVFANLILAGERVGLIDFANANPESHVLDDVYNLRVTCQNLLHVPQGLRRDLVSALESSLELEGCDRRVHRFFWEYHKRRWLHLQLSGGWARRARALALLPRMLRTEPLTLDRTAAGALIPNGAR